MAYTLAAVFIVVMSCFSHVVVMAENCESVEFTTDQCRSADYIEILNQKVYKGETKRIQLPGESETQVRWNCGSSEERTAWDTGANQLRIKYQSDGSIRWGIYKCADLSGPTKAGENCAVPETTEFCPKFDGANSSACVFELEKSTSNVNQKTTTVSIEGTLRAEVEKEAGPLTAKGSAEVKGGVSHSITDARRVTYKSRTFLVIPPGFSFCAFTNNTSVRDDNAPTGFRWRCSASPKYVKAEEKFSNGQCTGLEICDVGVCGRTVTQDGANSIHIPLAVLITGMIMALLRVY